MINLNEMLAPLGMLGELYFYYLTLSLSGQYQFISNQSLNPSDEPIKRIHPEVLDYLKHAPLDKVTQYCLKTDVVIEDKPRVNQGETILLIKKTALKLSAYCFNLKEDEQQYCQLAFNQGLFKRYALYFDCWLSAYPKESLFKMSANEVKSFFLDSALPYDLHPSRKRVLAKLLISIYVECLNQKERRFVYAYQQGASMSTIAKQYQVSRRYTLSILTRAAEKLGLSSPKELINLWQYRDLVFDHDFKNDRNLI